MINYSLEFLRISGLIVLRLSLNLIVDAILKIENWVGFEKEETQFSVFKVASTLKKNIVNFNKYLVEY